MRKTAGLIAAFLVVVAAGSVAAQNGQAAAAASKAPGASLKVSLVFSRYQGDKKISSVPHTLWVTADEQRSTLRMGTQIPVTSTVFSKEGERSQSYNYKDVGTSIDCGASSTAEGAFKLTVTIEDSSVYYPEPTETAAKSTSATGAPAFRSFHSTIRFVLRDGQTAQTASVTDPVSGQVVKLDATLNVQK